MRKSETYRNEIKSYIVRTGMTMEVCQRDKVAMMDFLKILFFIIPKS